MKPAKKKEATPLFIATNRGLMKCSLPEFEPSSYVGLKRGIGKTRRSSLHHPANADLLKKAKVKASNAAQEAARLEALPVVE